MSKATHYPGHENQMTQALAIPLPSPTGNLGGYLRAIQQFPMLSEDEEKRLAVELCQTGNIEAAWQLVTSHLRFVAKLARSYRGYGLAEDDLIQEGNVGLMKAVRRFDPEQRVRLAAFAVHWIRAEMHEFVLRNWRIVKIATTKAQRKLFFNLRGAKKALAQLSFEEAEDVAQDLNVKVCEVLEMDKRVASVDATVNSAGSEEAFNQTLHLASEGSDPGTTVAETEYAQKAQVQMASALASLDERSRDIVVRRWLKEPKMPLRELAEKYGVSMERIRQIEAESLAELRDVVEQAVGVP